VTDLLVILNITLKEDWWQMSKAKSTRCAARNKTENPKHVTKTVKN